MQIKLLIVDDLEDNRLVLRSVCKKIPNLQIFEAENGAIAVDMVEKERPHIVLMDVMMPVMDGFEATGLIKQAFPATNVLVVTAVSDKEVEAKFLTMGVDAYIRKPIDKESIRFKLENIISAIEIREGGKNVMGSKKPITPFTTDIRSMKTLFEIENEEDMMNLGVWLVDFYTSFNSSTTMLFDSTIDFLYKIMSKHIKNALALTVIAEQDFECVYLSFTLNCAIVMEDACRKFIELLGNNIIISNGFIYLRIDMRDVQKIIGVENMPKRFTPPTVESDKEKFSIDESSMSMLRKSHTEKLSAKEYVESLGGDIRDEMDELVEMENRWRELAGEFAHSGAKELLDVLSDAVVHKYAKTLNALYEFNALGYAISSLATFLKTVDVQKLENGGGAKLAMLLQHMIDDLEGWRNTIFVRQDTADIHYLDSSLFSSCMQIDALINEKQIENSDEDDVEFF